MQKDTPIKLAKTDKKAYQESVRTEIEHYASMYQNEESRKTLTEKVPASWFYVESKFNDLIRQKTTGVILLVKFTNTYACTPGGEY